ncbi:thrombospondin-type laminin G domain and EAR repeat-containing protein [Chiloscyllium plagiosum]|uniref:thrombospondin-type laminin G domain and EAR repeat-containing protein n=1 Tax=Chiloscyllium plagiosum TaxID=36176 RepID=UPI001CB7BD81|nr:thrombospondin-type laminin G domain and EAR repeat-containing protein [Chiloscyllium plagiosum]
MSTFLLLCALLHLGSHCSSATSYSPCTDLQPQDLLSKVIEAPWPQMNGFRMVQERGARGLRLSQNVKAASFPASHIFKICSYFPAEFSIVITLKVNYLPPKKNEYIFTLLQESSSHMLLGLRLSSDKLHLEFSQSDHPYSHRKRATFRDLHLADRHWHTLVLAVTANIVSLTIDCCPPVDMFLDVLFPEQLNTANSRFYVGSRRRRKGLFSVFLWSVITKNNLKEILGQVTKGLINEKELKSIFKEDQHVERQQLLGIALQTARAKERLDYVENYQNLVTNSETLDVEIFEIPNIGLFAATANRKPQPGSTIFKWLNGRFEPYQNITTYEAQAWKHFSIGPEVFLAVANFEKNERNQEYSVIYRWSKRRLRFVLYQRLPTHSARDWEAFQINGETFLAVANHREGNNHNIDSIIYKWNPNARMFERNQTIPTSGAYDWEFFTIGPYSFLVVANTFNGTSTRIYSRIYIQLGGMFRLFQSIPTYGATDWEVFRVQERVFLAVANSQSYETGAVNRVNAFNINSTIYELNITAQMFVKFQDIPTNSAVDWEFFTVGDDSFLVVANSFDGSKFFLNSVIYRWQGYESFVPVHQLPTYGCTDWEKFHTADGSYLIYSSAKERISKVLKLKTY